MPLQEARRFGRPTSWKAIAQTAKERSLTQKGSYRARLLPCHPGVEGQTTLPEGNCPPAKEKVPHPAAGVLDIAASRPRKAPLMPFQKQEKLRNSPASWNSNAETHNNRPMTGKEKGPTAQVDPFMPV
jgi:hypothetical protein